jgi:23S rRNA (cytosine1962-C5)-methyltransferase
MMTLSSNETAAPLYLNKGEERRLLSGHLWVFSNEINTKRNPLGNFDPGDGVDIYSHSGRWLGNGYVNPNSLICARIVSRDRSHPLSRSLLIHRIKVALSLRLRLFEHPFYRLVYGEGDGLPGLIIDRYDKYCVVQLTTAGMECRRKDILAAVDKVLRPSGILLRCDSEIRILEGLDSYVESVGSIPQEIELIEHDTRFVIPLRHGQKTGWYFDQRDNRARMLRLVRDHRVLDVCSYLGAWGIQAARHGASEVMCVDASKRTLDLVTRNAQINGVDNKVSSLRGDAFKALKELHEQGARFDVVILDPPAFIKRKKDIRSGEQAYQRLNQAALQLLEKDGLLITCSCSFHMQRQRFVHIVHRAARHLDRHLQLIYEGGQSMDHPVHPAMPETRYLKCLGLRVLPRM